MAAGAARGKKSAMCGTICVYYVTFACRLVTNMKMSLTPFNTVLQE